ncbi:MAG: MucB/RseB C-terminal domain-containing protein [Gammaproteobacteria bacterium]|jgi:sigma-E factor negative regulatory protein RseB|nr:MucB/RseB C-terminal domain-containing protein [Gammaproteobacteria bacterium]
MTSPRRVPPARMPLLLAIVGGLAATVADAADDPRTWLDRMGYALEYLNYEGTLIQLHGSEASVMHVVHRVEGGVPTERIKALDDVGREIIRRGGDVTCILPDQQSVLVEKGGAGAPGTSPLREQFTRDVRFDDRLYKLAIAGGGRLVGRDTRVVTVQPTDNYRYGYRLWLDHATAMPLKVQVSGEDGEVVEQLLFTNIELPGAIPESAVQPSVMVDKFARQAWPGAAPAATAGSVPSGWEVGFLPPGFGLRAVRAQGNGGSGGALEHRVYTDGVASVSIFIEGGVEQGEQGEGPSRIGAANAWTLRAGGNLVTAVGEVPVRTVEAIARSVRAPGR